MDIFLVMIEVWVQRFSLRAKEFVYVEQHLELEALIQVKRHKKVSWVKNLWIFLGGLVIFNPTPVMAILLLIFGTFFSFMLLDETE